MKKTTFAAMAVLAAIATATSPATAKEWSHVKVGIEGAFPPWNTLDAENKLAGFDVDLIKDLCTRAELDCELVTGPWKGMIPSLNAGKYDVIMTVGINAKRKEVIDFTTPYANGVASFLVPADSPDMPMTGEKLDLNDHEKADPVMDEIGGMLDRKTIGVVQSTSQEQLINAYFGDQVTVRSYENSGERDLDLKAGRIDAGFDSGIYETAMLDKPGNEDLKMTGPLVNGAMLATRVALGLRKGEDDLKAIFDKAINAAAEDGTIRELSLKWSKLDLTPDGSAAE